MELFPFGLFLLLNLIRGELLATLRVYHNRARQVPVRNGEPGNG